ncbi:Crp/Fnr family transcriptional regulator [Sinomicrobium sp. M5D2P17]
MYFCWKVCWFSSDVDILSEKLWIPLLYNKNNRKLKTDRNIEQAFEFLINDFNKFFPLDQKEKEEVLRLFKPRVLKRKAFLLQEGEICRDFTFVVSGCLRMYALDTNFKEHNLQFSVENTWISDIQSFYSEQQSKLYIEAIEPSMVLQIGHDDLLHLYVNYHKFDRNFRIIVEQKYMDYQQRILQNISSTAEDRYRTFIREFPNLVTRLPSTQIASYLGVTPEFLSKIRKKIAQKKTI